MAKYLNWIKGNWWRIQFSHICYCLLIVIILYFVFGEIKYHYHKTRLGKLSPKQIMNLSFKAAWKEDHDLQKEITHSSVEYTGDRKKTQDETVLRVLFAIKENAVHERVVEPNFIEVGYVYYSRFWPFSKARPGMHLLLKENGIWKLHSNKWKWGEMLDHLKKNPNDLSSYYICSWDMAIDQNFLLDYRFRKKYYELDPEGFWITKNFVEKLKVDEENFETNYGHYERQLLREVEMSTVSKQVKGHHLILLARLSMFHQDLDKAEQYLIDAENLHKHEKSTPYYFKESFDQAKNELKLRKGGNYIDPLDELDKLRAHMNQQIN